MRPKFIKHVTEVPQEGYERKPDGIAGFIRDIGAALGTEHVGVGVTTIRSGKKSSLFHHHKQKEEFFYVLEGRCRLRIGREVFDLQPGDAVCRPAGTGTAHQFFNPFPKACDVLMIGVMTGKGLSDEIAWPELGSSVKISTAGRRSARK